MKVPKRSSISRKLSLDDNDNDGGNDEVNEYEWKVVCWIDSKVSSILISFLAILSTCLQMYCI